MGDWRALVKDRDGHLMWEVVDTLGCLRYEEVDPEWERRIGEDDEPRLTEAAWREEMRQRDRDDEIRIARNEALDDLYREPEP